MAPDVLTLTFDGPVAVLGDVHGALDQLDRLLPQLEGRALLVLGDLCDRGPDTRSVLDRLIARGAQGVLGNHEEWFLAYAQGRGLDSFALSAAMGGRATLASYGIPGTTPRELEALRLLVPHEHRAFLEGLATIVDLAVFGTKYWLSHAAPSALPRDVPTADVLPHLARTRRAELRWSGTEPAAAPVLDRTLVMGHMRQDEPVDLGHVIALDTGAGLPGAGQLSALLLPERTFLSVR